MIDYYLLTKPGIILGNLITFTAVFLLASKESFQSHLFILTLLGLALIIASACVFNNYIDRFTDKKMARTKDRALAQGRIAKEKALFFAFVLLFFGNGLLLAYSHSLAFLFANLGFLIYVLLYSFLKKVTPLSTFIGSFAGAIPPLVGYVSAAKTVDINCLLIFFLLLFWQMPHFFSIGVWRYEHYLQANVPILPVYAGNFRTKIHICFYILLLLCTLATFTAVGITGVLFLLVTTLLCILWLFYALIGFWIKDHTKWGKNMFLFSLLMIHTICLLTVLDYRGNDKKLILGHFCPLEPDLNLFLTHIPLVVSR